MFLSDEKVRGIKKAALFFSNIPFAEFAILSGSCASGKARDDSDIDIIVGAEAGHVWTVRFLTLLFADACGIRHKEGDSKNKLCLSLFISPLNYRMNDPENDYEKELYPTLMPVFGKEDAIRGFFDENHGIVSDDFMEKKDLWVGGDKKWFARFMEWIIGESFGTRVEKRLRRIQISRINGYMNNFSSRTKNRIFLSDGRVETHFHVD